MRKISEAACSRYTYICYIYKPYDYIVLDCHLILRYSGGGGGGGGSTCACLCVCERERRGERERTLTLTRKL